METRLEQLYNNKSINNIYENCKWTNTLAHWKEIKEKSIENYWKNTVIFYQVWTFYECYFHDAHLASELVGQSLTSKNKNDPFAAPMSWSPLNAGYERAKKLVKSGYNVVIVEEIWVAWSKDFKRDITQVLTPWTNLDVVWSQSSNYLYSVYLEYNTLSISILDVSSNDFYSIERKIINKDDFSLLHKLFSIYPPIEIIWNKTFLESNLNNYLSQYNLTLIVQSLKDNYEDILNEHFSSKLKYLKESNLKASIYSISIILNYVEEIHQSKLEYINDISFISPEDFFFLDSATIKNLELFKNSDWTREHSLFNIIKNTSTSFGTRELRKELVCPLQNKEKIEKKLNWIEFLLWKEESLTSLIENLLQINDIERLSSKLSTVKCIPNDILSLTSSLELLEDIKEILTLQDNDFLQELNSKIFLFTKFIELSRRKLKESGWVSSREWNIIKKWINTKLDWYLNLTSDKDLWYLEYQQSLIKDTWITSLKVNENNLWAFIDVKKWTSVPDEWKRIKMLKDVDRYETTELVEFYRKTLDATNKRNELEYKLFHELRVELSLYISQIQKVTKELAKLDILCSHTLLAKNYNYIKPQIQENKNIHIEWGRHPVIERITNFEPNDIILTANNSLHIITWPNMWWKSTYIRQLAIIVLLTQIWSYVPAEKAIIWLVDWIYTRVWANDNLSQWESTFYVEMKETANILNSASKKSLIILDEVWRGTSTDDWFVISQSICEFLLEKWIRTVFATHYHELNNLEQLYSWVETYHVEAEINKENKLIFKHKIKKWGTDDSYWIEIWKLAWLPKEIIHRANQLKKILKK